MIDGCQRRHRSERSDEEFIDALQTGTRRAQRAAAVEHQVREVDAAIIELRPSADATGDATEEATEDEAAEEAHDGLQTAIGES